MAKIYRNGFEIGGSSGGGGGGASVYVGSLTLSSSSWSGSGDHYTQSVTLPGYTVTSNSKIDLQPSYEVLSQMETDETKALYVTNTNGTLTAHAYGSSPQANLTIQYSAMEVGS